ncbi:MAG: protein TolR [Pseudomonadota bacterium]
MATNKRRLMGEINVVPYIDVMLVLLIIFMVTAPLLTQGIEVNLPKANAAPLENPGEDVTPIVLSVDAQGALYLNAGEDKERPVDAGEIVRLVGVILKRRPDTKVLIKADTAVSHGRVVDAMVLLQRGGAQSVGIITDPQRSVDTVP